MGVGRGWNMMCASGQARGGRRERRGGLRRGDPPRPRPGAGHVAVGELDPGPPVEAGRGRRPGDPADRQDQGMGRSVDQEVRRSGQLDPGAGGHPVGRESAEADPGPGARGDPSPGGGAPADQRARRRRHRVRVAEDPGAEGAGGRGAPHLRGARGDLRTLRPYRHDLRGPDHRRVRGRCAAGGARHRDDGRTGGPGGRLMAVATRPEAPSASPAPHRRIRRPWAQKLLVQSIAVAVAFLFAGLVGSVIILAYGESPGFVSSTLWQFSTARVSDVARVLEQATPLIFSALAVAVAFKAGMFNIGVEGQYIVGMMTATMAAVWLDLPAALHLPLVVLAPMAGSMTWAFVPAILKVKTGAHEVVTTIMMNGIAISLVAWALLNPLRTGDTGLVDLRSDRFPESAIIPPVAPALGLEDQIPGSAHLTWLFPLALLACAAVWFLLFRTRLGYEARAVGSSPGSAEAGGISIGATQLKVFLISGALAGFVGLNYLLGDAGFF